jgi:hypothetical protein
MRCDRQRGVAYSNHPRTFGWRGRVDGYRVSGVAPENRFKQIVSGKCRPLRKPSFGDDGHCGWAGLVAE